MARSPRRLTRSTEPLPLAPGAGYVMLHLWVTKATAQRIERLAAAEKAHPDRLAAAMLEQAAATAVSRLK